MSGEETSGSGGFDSLRNYGRSFAECEPKGWSKAKIMWKAFRVMQGEMGLAITTKLYPSAERA